MKFIQRFGVDSDFFQKLFVPTGCGLFVLSFSEFHSFLLSFPRLLDVFVGFFIHFIHRYASLYPDSTRFVGGRQALGGGPGGQGGEDVNEKKKTRSCGGTGGREDVGNPVDEILVRLKILIAVEFFQIGLLVGLICWVKGI